MSARSRETFHQLVTLPDSAIPLAEAALLMACEEYPQLEIGPYIDQLDHIADGVRTRVQAGDSARAVIDAINGSLFGELGFRGNPDNYYDPRNSFFNDVLERRIGIPITLSTVYLEIARRISFPMAGVGMPGRFLVKHVSREEEIVLDPFNRGAILTHEACVQLLDGLNGKAMEFTEDMLARVTHKQIVARMLNNLKGIYLKARTYEKALAMTDMMLLVNPGDMEQYRDRGSLRLELRQYEGATRDFEHYLEALPNSDQRPRIEEQLRKIRRIYAMLN